MSKWPMVPLGEVLIHRKEFIEINDLETYKRCRVQLHAQGIVIRDKLPGVEIRTKKQQVCKAGEFLVAEIDAKVGGYGLVPNELEAAIVSSHYFLFGLNESKLDGRFLAYFIQTPAFFEQVAAQGSTNYAAIRPTDVLRYALPLPPIDEQWQLVQRIDALAAKIDEAKRIRRQTIAESEALLQTERRRQFARSADQRVITLEEACDAIIDTLHSDPIYSPEGVPCVRSPDVYRGRLSLQHALKTSEEEYRRRTVRGEPAPGDIVYCRQGGGTGRAAVVRSGDRFSLGQAMMLLRPNTKLMDPDYLVHQLLSPAILEEQLQDCYIGTASPRVNIGSLKKFTLLVPALPLQHQVAAFLGNLEKLAASLQTEQQRAAQEVDAMLPAILDLAFKGVL